MNKKYKLTEIIDQISEEKKLKNKIKLIVKKEGFKNYENMIRKFLLTRSMASLRRYFKLKYKIDYSLKSYYYNFKHLENKKIKRSKLEQFLMKESVSKDFSELKINLENYLKKNTLEDLRKIIITKYKFKKSIETYYRLLKKHQIKYSKNDVNWYKIARKNGYKNIEHMFYCYPETIQKWQKISMCRLVHYIIGIKNLKKIKHTT